MKTRTDAVKYMDIAEFRERGYLQELNRLFLHPLGLALDVEVDPKTGEERLNGIWDCRDDPEGIRYEGDLLTELRAKASRIAATWQAREPARIEALGYMVQPTGGDDE